MGRVAELYEEMQQAEDPSAALYFDLCGALRRVVSGTATANDALVLAYGCNVSLSDVGLASVAEPHLNDDNLNEVF